MPTYIYETIESAPVRFEVKQSMRDEPLTRHPDTGVPVRRVISGGYGLMVKAAPVTAPCGQPAPRGGCGCGCACGHGH